MGDSVARVRELENIRQFLTGNALTLVLDVLFPDEGRNDAGDHAAPGRGAQPKPALGVQRQPLFGSPVPHPEISPELPVKPFENLLQARRWATSLVRWYNEEHRHSAIGFVTPNQRHAGQDVALLANRAEVYEAARQAKPLRWSTQTRKWSFIERVHLNPETPNLKEADAYKEAA